MNTPLTQSPVWRDPADIDLTHQSMLKASLMMRGSVVLIVEISDLWVFPEPRIKPHYSAGCKKGTTTSDMVTSNIMLESWAWTSTTTSSIFLQIITILNVFRLISPNVAKCNLLRMGDYSKEAPAFPMKKAIIPKTLRIHSSHLVYFLISRKSSSL
jgi:hypothetical protein